MFDVGEVVDRLWLVAATGTLQAPVLLKAPGGAAPRPESGRRSGRL